METDQLEPLRSTEGMVDYDRNSAAPQQLVRVHAGLIRSLTERVGLVPPEFKIVDHGRGPGMNAIDAVRLAIEAYWTRYAGIRARLPFRVFEHSCSNPHRSTRKMSIAWSRNFSADWRSSTASFLDGTRARFGI